MKKLQNKITGIAGLLIGLFILVGGLFVFTFIKYKDITSGGKSVVNFQSQIAGVIENITNTVQVTHKKTPDPLKAVYLTSYAAGNERFRNMLFNLIDNTEVNAVVIDIKDYTGRISFPVSDPYLISVGSAIDRISDIKEFIASLHEKDVYVIGRISSFQDSYLINIKPEWAVKDGEGKIWQDYKGIKWLDPGAKPVWDYLVAVGREAYSVGFDELNFDYIRYPSDGDMANISYSWSDGRNRREVMRSFFLYLREQFATTSIPLSADLFGLTTSSNDDLGIGQNLVDALTYFDYVSPMVYPSHFAPGFIGLDKPAKYPYEVIKYSMGQAVIKANSASLDPNKIRPWLQAFNLGATYSPAMVRAQMQATYDAGLTSWMLWNAGSVYDAGALLVKGKL